MGYSLFLSFLAFSTAIELSYLSAPWTPFNNDQSVNYNAITCSQDLHAKNGVTHAWIAGNMGQWTSLTDDERLSLFQHWVAANKANTRKLNLIAHVGANSLQTACYLANATTTRFGKDLHGIAAIGPAYLSGPPSMEVLVNWIVSINNCQNIQPKLPLYYYHIPGTTGIRYKMADFTRALKAAGVHLAGIKFVNDDVLDFYNTSQFLGPTSTVFWAVSPKLRAMPFGAKAFVLAEDWLAPYEKVIADAYYAGDMATALQWELNWDQVMQAVSHGVERDVDGMLDPKCNVGPPRLPNLPSTPQQYTAMYNALEKIGFFTFVKSNWPSK